MSLWKRVSVEFLGTFWLVLGGCGTAILSSRFPVVGVGIVGVALAFGLALATGIYALGAVSGGHFNPAVTLGLTAARRFPAGEMAPYVAAQVAGAIAASALLYVIASGAPGFDAATGGFASNGYGAHSPGGYGLPAAALVELVMTFMFVVVVLGSTDVTALKGFGPLAIGLALTLIHLVSIPVTNTSVNPARSTGPALFAGGAALGQLWLFWMAPLVGAAAAGIVYPALTGARQGRAEAPHGTEVGKRADVGPSSRPVHER